MTYIVADNGCYGSPRASSRPPTTGLAVQEGEANPLMPSTCAGGDPLSAGFVARSFSGDKAQLIQRSRQPSATTALPSWMCQPVRDL
jgi:hypothetical protein